MAKERCKEGNMPYLNNLNNIRNLVEIRDDTQAHPVYESYKSMTVNIASKIGPWPRGLSTKDLVQSKVRLNFRYWKKSYAMPAS